MVENGGCFAGYDDKCGARFQLINQINGDIICYANGFVCNGHIDGKEVNVDLKNLDNGYVGLCQVAKSLRPIFELFIERAQAICRMSQDTDRSADDGHNLWKGQTSDYRLRDYGQARPTSCQPIRQSSEYLASNVVQDEVGVITYCGKLLQVGTSGEFFDKLNWT